MLSPQYPPCVSWNLQLVEQLVQVAPYSAFAQGVPLVAPLSHSSTLRNRKLSPHTFLRQLVVHPSSLMVFPSSHCSPASATPLPHALAGPQADQADH